MNAFYFTQRTSARFLAVMALFSLVSSMVPTQAFAMEVPDLPPIDCPLGGVADSEGVCQGGGACPDGQVGIYPICAAPIVDVCPNIKGPQAVVPVGKVIVEGQCVDTLPPPIFCSVESASNFGEPFPCEFPPIEPQICTVTIVSDTTNFVVEKNANAKALSFVHGAWITGLSPAAWIWGDNPVVDPSIVETQTFQKKFGFSGSVTTATLEVASDNTHSAVVNGTTLPAGGSTFGSPVSYNVTSDIEQGNNELNIAVTNLAQGTDPQSNPAGLKYKLIITGTPNEGQEGCAVPYVPPVVDVCSNLDGTQASIPEGYHRGEKNTCDKDVPPVCKVGKNLLVNGSFEEDQGLSNNNWGIFTSVLGWNYSLSDGIEIWRNFLTTPSDGAQLVELDANDATKITQTVATTPGATYELRFDFAARSADALDNHILATADGVTLEDVSTANTNWTTYSKTFVADGSTDIAFADLGTAQDGGGTGTLLDNAVLCYVAAPVDFCPNIEGLQSENSGYTKDVNGKCYMPIESCSLSVVSDTSNLVNESGAFVVTPHSRWITSIPGSLAAWIWGTVEGTPVNAVSNEAQVFTKTFVWSGTPATALLKISSDNGYSVKLNNTPVGSDTDEFNYQSVDSIINLTDDLIQGVNTLEITVTNKVILGESSWSNNPGGLLYDLTITNTTGNCAPDGGGSEEILGCTDESATNFSSLATVNDESCLYQTGGGGGGGSSRRTPTGAGTVLGISDEIEPTGEVLGAQVSAIPAGAPNAGAGGTSPFSLGFVSVAPVAFLRRLRIHG